MIVELEDKERKKRHATNDGERVELLTQIRELNAELGLSGHAQETKVLEKKSISLGGSEEA